MSDLHNIREEEAVYERFLDLWDDNEDFQDIVSNLFDKSTFNRWCNEGYNPFDELGLIFDKVYEWDADLMYGDVFEATLEYVAKFAE